MDFASLARALAPEAALVIGALAVLGTDLMALRGAGLPRRTRAAAGIGALACVAAVVLACLVGKMGGVFGGVIILDELAVVTRVAVVGLALLILGMGTGAPPNRNPAEFVAVMLLGAVGLLLMAAAQHLLLVFVAVELASLSLYVLTGFDKSRPESAEAALKYFLVGGVSAAFLLFGFSLLYGVTGSLSLPGVSAGLAGAGWSPVTAVAVVMVVVSLGFKVAAAPFHLWAPDAYQGAPAASAALVASASKLAGVVLFARLLWPGLYPEAGSAGDFRTTVMGWQLVVLAVAAASLVLGNVVALVQENIRRLLAYSAIAHAGALLLGVVVAGPFGPASLVYYAATYGLATAGVFGVIAAVESAGGCQRLDDLAGLHRRSPLLAGCLLVFVLSLAGIPPLAGFFGKFLVFADALKAGGVDGPVGWVAVLAILLSVVGLYYYLVILKQALVAPPRSGAPPVAVPFASAASLLTAAGLVLALGVWPDALLRLLE